MTQLTEEVIQTLVYKSVEVRQNARVPFSGYKVGAALLAEDGTIYTGCNMEIANMMHTICAERAALAKATSEGRHHFKAIAVVGDSPDPISPCGICRQTLSDFGLDIQVIMVTTRSNERLIKTVGELLPHAFLGSGDR